VLGEVVGVWRFDSRGTLFEVLLLHAIQIQRGILEVVLVVSPEQERYQVGHVLLQFGQVSRHVVFVELEVRIVVLVTRHTLHALEVRRVEQHYHVSDAFSNSSHLTLNKLNLVLLVGNRRLHLFRGLDKLFARFKLVGRVHRELFLVLLDFILDQLVLFVDHVDLAVQNVNIVPQRDVLLFSLDKGGHNLFG